MLPLCDVSDFGRKVHEWKNTINAPLRVLNYLYVTFQILAEKCMNGIKYNYCTFQTAILPLCDISDIGRKVHEWIKIPMLQQYQFLLETETSLTTIE